MRISDWSSDVCSSDLRLNSLLPQRAVSINEFNATKRLIVNPGGEPFVYDQKLTPYDRAINDACDHIDVRVIAVKGSVRSSKTLSAESMLLRNLTYGPSGNILWFMRSEEHTSELQSLMRTSYAVFCLKKKKNKTKKQKNQKST